jgi:hypothetical protein
MKPCWIIRWRIYTTMLEPVLMSGLSPGHGQWHLLLESLPAFFTNTFLRNVWLRKINKEIKWFVTTRIKNPLFLYFGTRQGTGIFLMHPKAHPIRGPNTSSFGYLRYTILSNTKEMLSIEDSKVPIICYFSHVPFILIFRHVTRK